MKHLRYAAYVIRHKWFVAIECFRHGLYWRGLVHDLSKFLPGEWFPYVEFFHGLRSDSVDAAFDLAWLLHQKRNDHHWQWWVLPEDDGGTKVLPMSEAALLEMVCDWCGASRAKGYGGWGGSTGVAAWYQKNGAKMQLHAATRQGIEFFMRKKLTAQ
jgi:hypothetical protein